MSSMSGQSSRNTDTIIIKIGLKPSYKPTFTSLFEKVPYIILFILLL